MGTVTDLVPVTGLAANFSPMPRRAPPPLGSVICGAANGELSAVGPFWPFAPVVVLSAMGHPASLRHRGRRTRHRSGTRSPIDATRVPCRRVAGARRTDPDLSSGPRPLTRRRPFVHGVRDSTVARSRVVLRQVTRYGGSAWHLPPGRDGEGQWHSAALSRHQRAERSLTDRELVASGPLDDRCNERPKG
jgi:hypothetical protein